VDFYVLVNLVKGLIEWLSAHKSLLTLPTTAFIAIRDAPLILEILRNVAFPKGLEIANEILNMALEYDPGEGSIEEFVEKRIWRLHEERR
jgi:hypothetical protein